MFHVCQQAVTAAPEAEACAHLVCAEKRIQDVPRTGCRAEAGCGTKQSLRNVSAYAMMWTEWGSPKPPASGVIGVPLLWSGAGGEGKRAGQARSVHQNGRSLNLKLEALYGLLIPFLGTALGSACVFFVKKDLSDHLQRGLTGFAAGVMTAASVWSLLIPALDRAADMGKWSFLPAAAGFWIGILFLLALDHLIPHLHVGSDQAEGPKSKLGRTTMMVLAVTLHNIPEGMAVGVMYAGFLAENAQITATSALALSLGIAIQNFPEGAIISMPLRAEGESKRKAFLGGVLSGVVEPIGAVMTILVAQLVIPALPYLLSFAAGAMLYVVVEELIPEMSQGQHSNIGTLFFALGFSLMMILDVALG